MSITGPVNPTVIQGIIDWALQPKQFMAQQCPAREVMYGGAAGGGKTDLLLYKALEHCLMYAGAKAIIFRRTYPELEQEIIPRSKQKFVFQDGKPIGRYIESKKMWRFPNGSVMFFRQAQHEKDIENYQGGEYSFVGFDELTKFTHYQYAYMRSRARTTLPGVIPQIISTTNPGGVGHGWVKHYFRVHDKSMKIFRDPETGLTRCFIPAKLDDNKILMDADPLYEANLRSLPDALRRALREGDWEVFAGQVFTEFKNDPSGYRSHIGTHVIEPFVIPASWKRFRSYDFGYAKPFSVAWWAVDHEGRVYRYREYYGCTGTPNEGVKLHPREVARKIKEIEDAFEKDAGGTKYIVRGIADPSIWDASRGESIADQMAAERVYFDPGDNARLAGKMQLHYRLAFGPDNKPMLYSFTTCPEFNRTIPELVYSDTKVEDINTDGEDHIYDEARYFLMDNPMNPPQYLPSAPKPYDPLSANEPVRMYGFMNM